MVPPGLDQDLVREAEGGADFFARAPAGGNGRDAVVNDLGRRAQRQQVSEVQGGGARNRGDSRGPARTPPVHERPPARLPRVSPVLGIHERVRAEDGTGHRCRAPGAAVCMDDGGANGVSDTLELLAYDPQTSGGLLVAVAPSAATDARRAMMAAGVAAHQVGTVEPAQQGVRILIRP